MANQHRPRRSGVVAAQRRPTPAARSGDATLSSVDNALLLLRLIGQRSVMRVSDASAELGVARSTAHRLLTTLKARDFVIQDKPNGAYRLGPAIDEIGLAATRSP